MRSFLFQNLNQLQTDRVLCKQSTHTYHTHVAAMKSRVESASVFQTFGQKQNFSGVFLALHEIERLCWCNAIRSNGGILDYDIKTNKFT